MQNDDELVEKVRTKLSWTPLLGTDGLVLGDAVLDVVVSCFDCRADHKKAAAHVRSIEESLARAAIAVMREAGWTPPIFSHALTMGSAAYKVKLGPSGNLVYEPVDLYETEKPATSEGAG